MGDEQDNAHANEQAAGSAKRGPQVVEVDWSSEPPPVYANGANAAHTEQEFSLIFTELAPFMGRGSSDGRGQPRARVVSSVRMAPQVFFHLVVSFASNWNKFVLRYGDAHNTPRFKLIGGHGYQLEGLEAPEAFEDDET